MIDLYRQHFGFSERPFSLLPDPDFIFWSTVHMRAFDILMYGMSTHAPITVITGEVGTGKTTLLHALLGTVEADRTVGLLSNATSQNGSMMRWILGAYSIPHSETADNVTLFQTFLDFMVAEYTKGKVVLLIIDEAQNLSLEALEELRMLTNVNANKDELFQLVLLGQPELRNMIMQPELRQFSQRVSVTYHLNPMDEPTTASYIVHRLKHVGGSGNEIEPAAVTAIHTMSHGIPRVVNKICDLALVYAAGEQKPSVDRGIVEELYSDGLVLIPNTQPFLLANALDDLNKVAE